MHHWFTVLLASTVSVLLPSGIELTATKQTEMTDASSRDRSQKGNYITRESEEEEDQRERTSYIDYLYVISLLCNHILRRPEGTKLVITQLNAGIIGKFIASSPRPYLLC